MSLQIGQTLSNRYHVQKFIGRGGMAEVYRVWDRERAASFALKLLHEDLALDVVFLRRFKREANTLASLQHPNIVRFYGLEEDGLMAFMLMEYVEGESLRAEIKRRAGVGLPPEQILEVLRPVCSALHYAHRSRIIHCDVKPGNLMIENSGRVLVADFGIARASELATTSTMAGAGTPAYMAPEQILGRNLGPQTDLYALGVVLFEMLTGGERPFTGETAEITGTISQKIHWEHLKTRPPSPRHYNPQVTPEWESLVQKCLEKDPEKRFSSALELLSAVEQACGAQELEPPADSRPQASSHDIHPTLTDPRLKVESENLPGITPPPNADVRVISQPERKIRRRKVLFAVSLFALGLLAVFGWLILGSGGVRIAETPRDRVPAGQPVSGADTAIARSGTATSSPPGPTAVIPSQVALLPSSTAPLPSLTVPAPGPTPTPINLTDQVSNLLASIPGNLPRITTQNAVMLVQEVASEIDGHFTWLHDRQLLALSSPDGLHVYDIQSWREIYYIENAVQVSGLAISPEGSLLATGSLDGWIKLWRTSDGELIRSWEAYDYGVRSLAFSPDGKTLASGSEYSTLRVWDAVDGQLLHELDVRDARLTDLAFSPDGELLAASDLDGLIWVWQVERGRSQYTLRGHKAAVYAVIFSPDGRFLASGSLDGDVRLWRVQTGESYDVFDGHMGKVNCLAFSADGELLASGAEDRTVRLWRTRDGEMLRTLDDPTDGVQNVAFVSDGSILAAMTGNGQFHLWRPADRQIIYTIENGHTSRVSSLAFSPTGEILASGAMDGWVRTWQVEDGEQLHALVPKSAAVRSVAFSPDGELLAGATDDGAVQVWQANGRFVRLLQTPNRLQSVAFSPDGKLLAAGLSSGEIRLWQIEDWTLLSTLRGPSQVNDLAFSPDGVLLAAALTSGEVELWNVPAGQPLHLLEGHTQVVSSVVFSPDGTILASGSWDGTVRLWRSKSGEPLRVMGPTSGYIYDIDFSPHGMLLAAGADSGIVRLWRTIDGEPIGILEVGKPRQVASLAFSPDSASLALGLSDGSIELWALP